MKYKLQTQSQNQRSSFSKPVCRICYSDSFVHDNPLIQPCKCTGTMKNIHLCCLQRWITSRMCLNPEFDDSNVISLLWEGLKCELCLTSLPFQYQHNGESFDLINFGEMFKIENRSLSKFLLIESWAKNGSSIGLFFADFSEKNLVTIVI